MSTTSFTSRFEIFALRWFKEQLPHIRLTDPEFLPRYTFMLETIETHGIKAGIAEIAEQQEMGDGEVLLECAEDFWRQLVNNPGDR